MIFTTFLVGLPAMLLCLAIQSAIAFWCVRHFIRRMQAYKEEQRTSAGLRPLLVAMTTMMLGMSAAALMAILQHMIKSQLA